MYTFPFNMITMIRFFSRCLLRTFRAILKIKKFPFQSSSSLIIVINCIAILCHLEPDEKFCNGKADGLYVDPNDFSNFYQCDNGITYWKHCPEGLLFNPDLNVCDWPTNVKYRAGGQKDVDEGRHHGGSIIQILEKSEGLETSILSKQQ